MECSSSNEFKNCCAKENSSDSFHESHHKVCSTQHIQLVCESLINSRNFERLEKFLWALPPDDEMETIEIVSIAEAFIAFRNKEYHKLYTILERRNFSKKYHRQLQMLWRSSHYMEAEQLRGRTLGAVGKYRIRRKYPFPKSIWNGENISYSFQEEARNLLNATYSKTPYPNLSEKRLLAESANLTVTQVSNWFKNKRQRARANGQKHIKIINEDKESTKEIATPGLHASKEQYSTPEEHMSSTQSEPPSLIHIPPTKRLIKPIFYRINTPTFYPDKSTSIRSQILAMHHRRELYAYNMIKYAPTRIYHSCTCHMKHRNTEEHSQRQAIFDT